MNRQGFALVALLLILAAALVGGAAAHYFAQKVPVNQPLGGQSRATSTQSQSSSSTVQVWSAVDIFGNPTGVTGRSFTNTSTQTVVSFSKTVKDDGSAYGSVDVFVNGKQIGSAQADLESLFSFSPNGHYFGFRAQYHIGAGSFSYELKIINLVSSTEMDIPSPYVEARTYPKSKINSRVSDISNLDATIESYSWDGGGVNVVFYFTVAEYDEGANKTTYYRATPKELWRYDLATKQYVFIRDIPEPATTPISCKLSVVPKEILAARGKSFVNE